VVDRPTYEHLNDIGAAFIGAEHQLEQHFGKLCQAVAAALHHHSKTEAGDCAPGFHLPAMAEALGCSVWPTPESVTGAGHASCSGAGWKNP
jgi:hypothetical protein